MVFIHNVALLRCLKQCKYFKVFWGRDFMTFFNLSRRTINSYQRPCQKNGFIKITFKSVGDTINGHFRWRMEDEDFFSAILHLWEAGLQKENMLKLYLWMFPNKWLAINEFKFCWKHHLKDEKISMHFENDNHQKYWCGRPLKAIPWFF